jgi:hypothetical protein
MIYSNELKQERERHKVKTFYGIEESPSNSAETIYALNAAESLNTAHVINCNSEHHFEQGFKELLWVGEKRILMLRKLL